MFLHQLSLGSLGFCPVSWPVRGFWEEILFWVLQNFKGPVLVLLKEPKPSSSSDYYYYFKRWFQIGSVLGMGFITRNSGLNMQNNPKTCKFET